MESHRYERILCPTDFSSFSVAALRHAMSLREKLGGTLRVLHVIPHAFTPGENRYGAAPFLLLPDMRKHAEAQMKAFLEPCRTGRVDHVIEMREGDPARETLSAIKDSRADLVVVGTHGASGFERFLLGSVSEKVIQRASCDALTIGHEEGRTWETPGLITRIVCATDFSEEGSEAVSRAGELARTYGSSVTLVHVIENIPYISVDIFGGFLESQAMRRNVIEVAETRLNEIAGSPALSGVQVETRVLTGATAHDALLEDIVKERADLLVIGARGHGAMDRLLFGSTALQIVRRATCPVLSVRRSIEAASAKPATGVVAVDTKKS
jgi:nucleotide-binding universal stress UspA family protein